MGLIGFYTKNGEPRPITERESKEVRTIPVETGTLYVMNSPLITSEGLFRYRRISQEEAKRLLSEGFVSAIGHDATSKFATAVFSTDVPMNRIAVKMEKGDRAIVIKPIGRLPEGKILTTEEMQAIPYEIGLIERIE